MRRMILGAMVLSAALAPADAAVGGREGFRGPAAFRNDVVDRWTGRWVVTRVETRSDCSGVYTDNLAGGRRIASGGRERFAAGTPARVDSVDVSASHVSLRLTLSELLLVTRPYREVTLRDEARCQVELKIGVPPGVVESGDLIGLETSLEPLVERYRNEGSALLASNFLPDGDPARAAMRQDAIAAHQEWKQEQASGAYEARMGEWVRLTTRLSGQISTDPDYLDGFARGVEVGRSAPARNCADIVRDGPALPSSGRPARAVAAAKGRRQKTWARGYDDGVRLVLGLRAIEVMPQCASQAAPEGRRAPGLEGRTRGPARPAPVVPAETGPGR